MANLVPTRFLPGFLAGFLPRCIRRCLLILLLTVSSTASAQQPGCGQSTPDAVSITANPKTEIDSPAAAGLRVFIDPQTGEFMSEPPAGTAPAVEATAAEPRPELVEQVRPDGSVMVRLDDRFQTPLQAGLEGDQLIACHGDQHQHD